MREALESRLRRFEELERLLADPAVLGDPRQVRAYAREHAGLKGLADLARQLEQVQSQIHQVR